VSADEFRRRPRATTLFGLPVIVEKFDLSDDLPCDLKEALARRQIVSAGGTCPCGARAIPPNRAARRRAVRRGQPVIVSEVHHADECLAAFKGLALVDLGIDGDQS
jgi:hypothetical protein